jgi:hypothetical protein
MRDPTQEKRIVVVGKSSGETLLDVTLGESCFERVARSGIAVSVWEDIIGPGGQVGIAGAVGGVSGAKARVYMIQVCWRLHAFCVVVLLTIALDEDRTRVRVLILLARQTSILSRHHPFNNPYLFEYFSLGAFIFQHSGNRHLPFGCALQFRFGPLP